MYAKTLFHIVLIEPEIPQNTGNIGRMCAGAWAELHLVGKLGFSLEDRQLKRAGLDYWPKLKWHRHESWAQWWDIVPDKERIFFFSTKAQQNFFNLKLQEGDWLVFGKETKGLPAEVISTHADQCYKISMPGDIRSFNLANTVAMALGEGLRQTL